MKTLILMGSPRKKGHTIQLVEELCQYLTTDIEILSLYHRQDIKPCQDCRYCFTHKGCCVEDAMQEIYQKLEAADQIIFAAPVYFYNLPGAMKIVLDRLQVYWAARVRKEQTLQGKKGGMLLVGGAPEFPGQFEGTIQTVQCMLEDLGAECAGIVTMGGSDQKGLSERPDVKEKIQKLAQALQK